MKLKSGRSSEANRRDMQLVSNTLRRKGWTKQLPQPGYGTIVSWTKVGDMSLGIRVTVGSNGTITKVEVGKSYGSNVSSYSKRLKRLPTPERLADILG